MILSLQSWKKEKKKKRTMYVDDFYKLDGRHFFLKKSYE